jgi:hypothetical protein
LRHGGFGDDPDAHGKRSLVQIETQGIAHGLPFSFTAEARRVGVCRR